jgi:transporter family protein
MNQNYWFLWALLSAVFAALTAILAKVGLRELNADYANLLRTLVILLFLSGFVYATGAWQSPLRLSKEAIGFVVASGLAAGVSWLCYFRALKLADASKVAPVDKFSVVLVAILAYVVLGERPSAWQWSAIGLITVGTIILAVKR